METYIENETGIIFNFRGYKKLIKNVADIFYEIFDIPSYTELDVLITTPDHIREINRETRGIDKVTDVLSFPYFEFESPGKLVGFDSETETIFGEIVICADRVIAQAEEYGHSQKRELAYLTVHSMLHLLGYDHVTEKDEELMNSVAEEMMNKLKIARTL